VASQEEITEQQELLATHRRTLAHYLRQHAQLGSSHVPPGIVHGIYEASREIQRIKSVLQAWGIPVEDHPDDEAFVRVSGSTFQEQMTAESLQEQQRKAILLALDWISLIEAALNQAKSLISALRQGTIDEDEYLRSFPNILAVLSRMDLPIHLHIVLPEGIYPKGLDIVWDFDKVRAMGLMMHTCTLIDCTEATYNIDIKIERLYKCLKEEYIKTYS